MGRTIKIGSKGHALDLSGLLDESEKNEAIEGACNGENRQEGCNSLAGGQRPPGATIGAVQGEQAEPLLLEHEMMIEHRRYEFAVYKAYQENIIKSEQLQNEILTGVKAGEDICSLFLKAAKAIAIMTGDAVFYDQLMKAAQDVYGARPAQEEQGRVVGREQIEMAIQAHKKRIAELEELKD